MIYHISDCCGERIVFWDEDDCPICPACDEPCETEKVLNLDREDIAYEKARQRGWED